MYGLAIFTVSSVILCTAIMRMSCSVNSRRLAGSEVPDNLRQVNYEFVMKIYPILSECIFDSTVILNQNILDGVLESGHDFQAYY